MRDQDHSPSELDQARGQVGFPFEDFGGYAGNDTLTECLDESRFVDERSPDRVDEAGGAGHARQAPSVDQVTGLRPEGRVQTHEVEQRQQHIQAHFACAIAAGSGEFLSPP